MEYIFPFCPFSYANEQTNSTINYQFGGCSLNSSYGDNMIINYCVMNGLILYILIIFIIVRLVQMYQKRKCISLKKNIDRSIFGYLVKDRCLFSYFIYILMTIGIIFLRPLSAIFETNFFEIYAQGGSKWFQFYGYLGQGISGMIYFFLILFMINFYGIKSEILHLTGNLMIKRSLRNEFIKMVIHRSSTFCIVYLIATLSAFSVGGSFLSIACDQRGFAWIVYSLENTFLLIMAYSRISYLNHAQRETDYKLQEQIRGYKTEPLKRYITDYLLPNELISHLIKDLDPLEEDDFLEVFEMNINNKQLKVKYKNNINIQTQEGNELIQNVDLDTEIKQEHVTAGLIWLVFTIVNLSLNTIISLIIMLILMLGIDMAEWEMEILAWLQVLIYFVETICQAVLIYIIMSDKSNYGEVIGDKKSLLQSFHVKVPKDENPRKYSAKYRKNNVIHDDPVEPHISEAGDSLIIHDEHEDLHISF